MLIDAQGEIHSDAFDSILAVNSDTGERRFIARKLFDDVERATLLDAQGQPLLDRYYDAIYAQSGRADHAARRTAGRAGLAGQ